MTVASISRKAGALLLVLSATLVAMLALTACSSTSASGPTIEAELVYAPGVPAPLDRPAKNVVVSLETIEKRVEIAPGVEYDIWTFNGAVPGPFIRVRQWDTVEIRLKNSAGSSMPHSIDLHAVTGPGGGATLTGVAPGEEKAFQFKALTPGLYVYHCASGVVADHIANGMYGLILVEPPSSLASVDHEFYVMQGEFYTTGDTGEKGLQHQDVARLLSEETQYVVFNGNTQSLIGDRALQARVGETVRIYVGNAGPNLVSSFHVIGEIFDRVYDQAALESSPLEGVQTTLVPAGGAAIVEFELDVPGDYKLVDHSLGRLLKGAVGTLHVEGRDNPDVFGLVEESPGSTASQPMPQGDHSFPTELTATPAATSAATAAPAAADGAVLVSMGDNFFEPKEIAVQTGEEVSFELANDGALPHNMRIAGPDGKFNTGDDIVSSPDVVLGSQNATLEWQGAASPGTIPFQCDIHPGVMAGTITVR
jgi:nitrite reductase (NO-forming)